MHKVIRRLPSYSQHCLHLFNSYHIRIIVEQSNHSIPINFYQCPAETVYSSSVERLSIRRVFSFLLTARDFRFFKSQLTVWDNRFFSSRRELTTSQTPRLVYRLWCGASSQGVISNCITAIIAVCKKKYRYITPRLASSWIIATIAIPPVRAKTFKKL